MRRALDILVAVAGLVVTAPVMAAAMIAIRLETRGRAIYRQRRVGLHGREFDVLKLRTMVDGAEAIGAGMAVNVGDARITRVGKFLRRTSLDELPNLVNILRGDMSLVGPRPCIPYEVDNFAPHHFERFLVPAGVTGLWQVSARANATFGEALDMDVAYVRGWSLRLDLRLLFRTPVQVISRRASTR